MKNIFSKMGFSLIELSLALAILLIIIPTMIPVYEAFLGDITDQALRQRLMEVRRALQVFFLEHGRYPNQIFDRYGNNVDFTDDTRSELVNGIHNGFGDYPTNRRTYIAALPPDPVTEKVDWLLVPMDNDGDGLFNEDKDWEVTTGTHLVTARFRGLTTGVVRYDDFISFDDDNDGQYDEDPIDVGDVKSRAPGFEQY